MNIEKLRKSLTDAGVYSLDDINEICRLEKEYQEECDVISEECVAEGYPSHGSNYDLRCEQARKYYDEQLSYINEKYE